MSCLGRKLFRGLVRPRLSDVSAQEVRLPWLCLCLGAPGGGGGKSLAGVMSINLGTRVLCQSIVS